MAKYTTEYGGTFNTEAEARSYANTAAAAEAYNRARDKKAMDEAAEPYNKMVRLSNAGDWEGVIKQAEENERNNYNYGRLDNQYCKLDDRNTEANLIISIARAYRDSDYESVFLKFLHYQNGIKTEFSDSNIGKLQKAALEAGKKAFAKRNGREMTENDFIQFCTSYLERNIATNINENKFAGYNISNWKKFTGRNMTKAEQIRIAGKPFPKSLVSISASPTAQRNGFVSFLFGLVCGAGVLLTSLWILVLFTGVITSGLLIFGLLAVGIVSAIIAGKAWRNKKNVIFIIMLVAGIIGWFSLIGLMPNSLKSIFANAQEARNTTEQTSGD